MIGTKAERMEALDKLYPLWKEHTPWTLLEQISLCDGDAIFLCTEDCQYSYQQTVENVLHMARALYSLGVRAGQHVALKLPNCPEYLFLNLALSRLSAVCVPVHTKASSAQVQFILEQADVSWLLEAGSGGSAYDIHAMQWFHITQGQPQQVMSWDLFCAAQTDVTLPTDVMSVHDLSQIMFTSGSTATPKGVMLTSDMLLRSAYATCRTRCMEIGRRIFVPIPFYHAFAYVEGILAAMHVHGCVIFSRYAFQVDHALEMMAGYEANDIICVPTVMIKLLEHSKVVPERFPALHAAYWAGICPEWLWDMGSEKFGIEDITTGYGMTECGSTTFLMPAGSPISKVKKYHGVRKEAGQAAMPQGSGRILEVRICDPQDEDSVLPPGVPGELQCYGPSVTPGYYRNDLANTRAFTKTGWFRTGDLCIAHENGYYCFMGRMDDQYKINGENVSPDYVSSVLRTFDGVRDAQVLGISHVKYGAVGIAFLDAGAYSPLRARQLADFCHKNLANFQIPMYMIWGVRDNWPLTETGKISKTAMRSWAEELISQAEYKQHDLIGAGQMDICNIDLQARTSLVV